MYHEAVQNLSIDEFYGDTESSEYFCKQDFSDFNLSQCSASNGNKFASEYSSDFAAVSQQQFWYIQQDKSSQVFSENAPLYFDATKQSLLDSTCELGMIIQQDDFQQFLCFLLKYNVTGDSTLLWAKAKQLVACDWQVPRKFSAACLFYQFILSLDLAYGIKDIGYFDKQPFYFELLPGTMPVALKPYRYVGVKQQFVDQQVDLMLQHDIIEKVEYSPWAFPVVVAPKPHLTAEERQNLPLEKVWRFCTDFRQLNDCTVMDSYVLPTCREILTSLNNAKFFVRLDLQSGYWQIGVDQQVSSCLTFIVQRGTYRYKRMPFGPKTAPLWFQRVMDNLLREYIGKICYVYLDDVIVYGSTIEEVLASAKIIINVLNSVGLRCNGPKCCFLTEQVYLLGHYIKDSTIYPDCERLNKLNSLGTPQNKQQVQSIFGLLNYYRDFVYNFALKVQPIAELLKGVNNKQSNKQQLVVWGQAQQKALDLVLNELSCTAGLYSPNFDREFILTTDFSGWGIAAVLSQYNDLGIEVPIQFASRRCLDAESRYPSVEGEALAIMFGLDKFSMFLVGRIFLLRTDAKALIHVSTMQGTNAKLTRWYLKMQQYQYRIQHIKGSLNVPSDVLSRLTNRQEQVVVEYFDIEYFDVLASNSINMRQVESFSSGTPSFSSESTESGPHPCHLCGNGCKKMLCLQCEINVKELNLKDITLDINLFGRLTTKLFDYTLSIKENQRIDKLVQKVSYEQGKYYIFDNKVKKQIPLYYIREQFVMDMHKSLRHAGINALYTTLRQQYWYEGMSSHVAKVISTCFECQCERAVEHPHRQLYPVDKRSLPFQGWSIDLIPMTIPGKNNEKYIILCVDVFSKWIEIGAIRSKASEITSRWFYENVLARYGLPHFVRHDNGVEWQLHFSNLLASYGIQSCSTTPYYPQSNGQAEKYVGVVKQSVRRYISSSGTCWTECLGDVAQGLRFCISRATGFSPFQLCFGFAARLPSSSFTGMQPTDMPESSQLQEDSEIQEGSLLEMIGRFSQMRVDARQNNARLDCYNADQHRNKNKKGKEIVGLLSVGSYVLIKNRLTSKLDSPFVGPCKLLGYSENYFSVRVQRPDGSIIVVSTTQVVPCVEQMGVENTFEDMFKSYPGPRRAKRKRQ